MTKFNIQATIKIIGSDKIIDQVLQDYDFESLVDHPSHNQEKVRGQFNRQIELDGSLSDYLVSQVQDFIHDDLQISIAGFYTQGCDDTFSHHFAQEFYDFSFDISPMMSSFTKDRLQTTERSFVQNGFYTGDTLESKADEIINTMIKNGHRLEEAKVIYKSMLMKNQYDGYITDKTIQLIAEY